MPDLSTSQWILAFVAAACIGISKSGFAGLGVFHVLVFAMLFGARTSTGILLPLLIFGDIWSVIAFGKLAHWQYIRKVFPPAAIGVVIGWALMTRIGEASYRPVIGWIVLSLALLQAARMARPHWFAHIPHAVWFAWTLGLFAGVTTMLANAAGPIVALYLLAVSLPKQELVSTSAWFFLLLNVYKIPFSFQLGLIGPTTLSLNLVLAPAVIAGTFIGRWLIRMVPQKLFDGLVLTFVGVAALWLIFGTLVLDALN
jgi:uncharacterized membrane protein YfcA